MHAVTHSHTCTHMWARIYRNMYTRCVLSMYTPTLFFVRLNGVRRGASGGCRRAFRFGGSRQRGYGCTHICDKMHADKHTHLCAHMFALVYPNMYIRRVLSRTHRETHHIHKHDKRTQNDVYVYTYKFIVLAKLYALRAFFIRDM